MREFLGFKYALYPFSGYEYRAQFYTVNKKGKVIGFDIYTDNGNEFLVYEIINDFFDFDSASNIWGITGIELSGFYSRSAEARILQMIPGFQLCCNCANEYPQPPFDSGCQKGVIDVKKYSVSGGCPVWQQRK